MPFIILVAFSALFVAGCAAFFSIKGLIVLFSGSALAIGIMASSLEIGKLVAASFLHTYWSTMSKLLRLYLCLAVLTLMVVTSLGIFGFLSGAYQVHASTTASVETKIEALQSEQLTVNKTIEENSNRIKTLLEIRTTQEERVKTAGNYKAPRDQAYKAISEANEELSKKEESINKDRERTIELEKEISTLKVSLNANTDIGSFKFIAGAMNTKVDTAVKYFIFTLIAVFDPLAVALVLCWNRLLEIRATKRREDEEANEELIADLIAATQAQEQEEEEPALKKKIEPIVEESEIFSEEKEETLLSAEPEQPAAPAKKRKTKNATQESVVEDASLNKEVAILSEEEKKAERARINRILGKHDSVITNG